MQNSHNPQKNNSKRKIQIILTLNQSGNLRFSNQTKVGCINNAINIAKSKGTNNLIESNMAIPAINVEQILKHIGFSRINDSNDNKLIDFKNLEEEKVYNFLSFSPKHIDEIAHGLSMSIMEVQVTLLTLEFNSLVRQLPGNQFIRNIN